MPSFYHRERDYHPQLRDSWTHHEYDEQKDTIARPYGHHDRSDHDVRQQNSQDVPSPYRSLRNRRRWPPLPKAEEENVSLSNEYKPQWLDSRLEKVPFRGEIDQQPILEEVNPQPRQEGAYIAESSGNESEGIATPSSSEDSGPRTPVDSTNQNQDRRYVYIPKAGIEIPLTYDEAREPKYGKTKPGSVKSEVPRGRNERPRVHTNLDQILGPLPPRERAPSPYAFVPKPEKAKDPQHFGDHLLSPDALSPSVGLNQSAQRTSSRRPPEREPSRRGDTSRDKAGQPSTESRRPHSPKPPALDRTSSARRAAISPSIRDSDSKSRYHDASSDESSDGRHRSAKHHARLLSGSLSPESPRTMPMPAADDLSRRLGLRAGSGQAPTTPLPRARSAKPPPLSALPSGVVADSSLLSSPPLSGRKASPRASPVGSPAHTPPYSSPPRTPPSDRDHHRDRAPQRPYVGQRSRAHSHAPPPPSPQSSSFLQAENDHDRPARRYIPRSRATSPMPLPPSGRPHIDVRAPSPANHQKSFSHVTDESMHHNSRHLSLAPTDTPTSATLVPPSLGQRRRASSSSDVRPQLSLNATSAEDLSPSAFPPSPRSPSKSLRPALPGRAVSLGALPISLLPCPRPHPVAGYDDWYTLAGGPSTFSICPTCRDTFVSAGHEHHLRPKSRRTAEQYLRCDMSSPWTRIAYIALLKKRQTEINSLYALAEILADDEPCPGKSKERRDWYRLKDPDIGKSVHDFQICPCCVQQLEVALPSLRGMFHPSRSHGSEPRVCSFRLESTRLAAYAELLESTAKQSEEHRRPPNMFHFIELAKRYTDFQECARHELLKDQDWYFHPDLRELTVCEECYEEVVWPAIKRDMPIASDFKRHAKAVAPSHVGVSCQLYSPRMRRIFQDACHRNDMRLLENAALQRYNIEQDIEMSKHDIRHRPREERIREEAKLLEEWKRWE